MNLQDVRLGEYYKLFRDDYKWEADAIIKRQVKYKSRAESNVMFKRGENGEVVYKETSYKSIQCTWYTYEAQQQDVEDKRIKKEMKEAPIRAPFLTHGIEIIEIHDYGYRNTPVWSLDFTKENLDKLLLLLGEHEWNVNMGELEG